MAGQGIAVVRIPHLSACKSLARDQSRFNRTSKQSLYLRGELTSQAKRVKLLKETDTRRVTRGKSEREAISRDSQSGNSARFRIIELRTDILRSIGVTLPLDPAARYLPVSAAGGD